MKTTAIEKNKIYFSYLQALVFKMNDNRFILNF